MKKLMRITTVSLILSCVMAVSVFAGKWAGDDGGWTMEVTRETAGWRIRGNGIISPMDI